MNITPYKLAERFIGTTEIKGGIDNPQVMAMLNLDMKWPKHDEVPWCSAFVNYICWMLRLPRSKSLLARSWLDVGIPISLSKAEPICDIVILKRGKGDQPGPQNTTAPGHVGFFVSHKMYSTELSEIAILGGNQNNTVKVSNYSEENLLGIRRLYT